MKKYFKIIGMSLGAIGLVLFFAPNKLSQVRTMDDCFGFKIQLVCFGLADDLNSSTIQRKIDFWKTSNKFCGTKGMAVPTMARKCCKGLTEMWNTCAENDCGCKESFPSIGGLGICSNCGNGICERENNENHCNCHQDCGILETKAMKYPNCGNGKCESEYNESNKVCVEDCPIPIIANLKGNLSDAKGIQNYYEKFRKKCENDKCCLESFKKAKKARSEIFVWKNGKMPIDANCVSRYSLQKDDCETSYMWCEKINKN